MDKYEYTEKIPLSGIEKYYITIPSSIIFNLAMNNRRVAIFCYFSLYRGLHNKLFFSIPQILQWCNKVNDTHSGGINDKIKKLIEQLAEFDYIKYPIDKLTRTSLVEAEFNKQKVIEECQHESFAVLYADEIINILNSKKENKKDAYLDNTTLLLVFAFMRNCIYNRPNKLRPEECNTDNTNNLNIDIENRKKRSPEAYADYYKDIANRLGISERAVSKAIYELKNMNLIVVDETYHFKNDDDEYRTPYTLFANAYKREGGYLLASGETYSRNEIERKASKIRNKNPHFRINRKKRY